MGLALLLLAVLTPETLDLVLPALALFARGSVEAIELETILLDPLIRLMTCFSVLTGSRYHCLSGSSSPLSASLYKFEHVLLLLLLLPLIAAV